MKWAKPLPLFLAPEEGRAKRYIDDSLLVLGSILLVTGILSLFHLPDHIPDSLLLYLLIILALACIRGLYAALLASFCAFFVFDFFFIPPTYSLVASKFEDISGLVVFLITAIITGQLASTLRQRVIQSTQREHETRILYEFVRSTNRENDMESQLAVFVNALARVFSAWNIHDCMLLLSDEHGNLKSLPSANHWLENVGFSADERMMAGWVMESGRSVELYDRSLLPRPTNKGKRAQRRRDGGNDAALYYSIRLVPIKKGHQVLGILRLLTESDVSKQVIEDELAIDNSSPTPQAVFFSTFLEQAVTVIEQGRLRKESLSLKVFQQTEELRTALLSSVSHDLRTPLTTIKAAATSILEEEIQWNKEGIQTFASAIEREADRLDRLVENILDMSRIEAGLLRPQKMLYPFDELVYDVLERMQSLLQGREVAADIPGDLPPVALDYVQIDQVVTNLIENALWHTPVESPIEIKTDVQEEHVQFYIADRGPGVADFEREHIFDKFYRIQRGYGHSNSLGLGLSICRGIIEAHGGKIWMQPREGGGAEFYFTLPIEKTGEVYA